MRVLFADTFYWAALLSARDPWYARDAQVTEGLGDHRLYTTEAVFDEYLAFYSKAGPYFRQQAVRTVRRLLASPHVTVIPQTHDVFLPALDLYESRLDKGYSLTDCISMNVIRQEGITEVLSNDHHFEQEGFTLLFP